MHSHESILSDFCKLVEKKEYFEANEILEKLWRQEIAGDRKNCYRAMINGAVALVLIQKGRKSYGRPWAYFMTHAGLVEKMEFSLQPLCIKAITLLKAHYQFCLAECDG